MATTEVDFEGSTVGLDPGTTKNGEARVFPMTAELRALLEAQHAYTERVQREKGIICPHVSHRDGVPIRAWRRAWTSALLGAGLATKDPKTKKVTRARIAHDFRRTAVRNLVRAGIPERVAMQMTGHKTRAVFERYNSVSAGDLTDAARRLDAVAATRTLAVENVTGTITGTIGS